MQRLRNLVAATVLTMLLPLLVWGQSGNASLSATVHDATGAVIPAAEVKIINVNTGVAKTEATTAAGLVYFNELIPGTYRMEAKASGFGAKKIADF
jgi:hypothetical protein